MSPPTRVQSACSTPAAAAPPSPTQSARCSRSFPRSSAAPSPWSVTKPIQFAKASSLSSVFGEEREGRGGLSNSDGFPLPSSSVSVCVYLCFSPPFSPGKFLSPPARSPFQPLPSPPLLQSLASKSSD